MASVIIVDDSPDSCEPLARFLERSGHTVKCIDNGRDALAEMLARPSDVIVLDLLMPHMDGPSLLDVIRSYVRLRTMPAVVVTGLSDGPMIDRLSDLNVSAVLTKGKATLEELRRAVESAATHGLGSSFHA